MPYINFFWVFINLLLLSCTFSPNIHDTEVFSTQNRIYQSLKSVKELRDENVVKQGFDYSCGAGALATLLTYGLGDTVTEVEVMKKLLENLPKDIELLKKKQGFSLLDLQTIAQQHGHRAQGFRIAADQLPKLQNPVIVFIKPFGSPHFSVLKGVQGDRIYLADPSLGNVRMPIYQFLDIWLDNGKGIIFVVERQGNTSLVNNRLKLNQAEFNQPELFTIRQMLEANHSGILPIPLH